VTPEEKEGIKVHREHIARKFSSISLMYPSCFEMTETAAITMRAITV
jgi:hypothetical protein